ncbi:hypothetical protein UFOVP71_454 [uncultured Caudovirales phage]|uniref:Uncharacterized protein n=1 Tax=uncultured Caudovirales phage TaxID=2100421 RepID=A0A6J5TAG2_9CAUD|nr:hypothetical protein UFOVP71_454 [uncultured Caudovirales phage]
MDNRLNDALAFANYRLTLQVQRQNIEARVAAAKILSFQNAIFTATQDLIGYVGLLTVRGDTILVNDNSGNVIEILNPSDFLTLLIQTYNSAMKLKQEEQQRLKSARSTAKIVGL